jgi:hypothetical protein
MWGFSEGCFEGSDADKEGHGVKRPGPPGAGQPEEKSLPNPKPRTATPIPPGQYYPHGNFAIFQRRGSTGECQQSLSDSYERKIKILFWAFKKLIDSSYRHFTKVGGSIAR